MADHKGFFLYLDQYKPISKLTKEQKGELLEAMFAYNSGEEFVFSDTLVEMAFGFFEQTFERDQQRYADKCSKMRANAAKKQTQAEGSNCNQKLPIASRSIQQQEQKQEQKQEQDSKKEESTLTGTCRQPAADQSEEGPHQDEEVDSFIPLRPVSSGKPQPTEPCPHQSIVDLYHEILPEFPGVKVWNERRQKLLRSRWREKPERQNLEYWKKFFEYVRKSPFLMGHSNSPGRPPFVCTLEWLVMPSNFTHVIERKFHREQQ